MIQNAGLGWKFKIWAKGLGSSHGLSQISVVSHRNQSQWTLISISRLVLNNFLLLEIPKNGSVTISIYKQSKYSESRNMVRGVITGSQNINFFIAVTFSSNLIGQTTWLGFPPNLAMLSWTHCNATCWSLNPIFPGTAFSIARKPKGTVNQWNYDVPVVKTLPINAMTPAFLNLLYL